MMWQVETISRNPGTTIVRGLRQPQVGHKRNGLTSKAYQGTPVGGTPAAESF